MNRHRRHFIGCSAALAAMPLSALAGHVGQVPVPGARSQLAISAAFDRAGRLWVASVEPVIPGAGAAAPARILLRWSADQGATWTQAGAVLAEPEAVEANGEGRPKIAFGPGEAVYLTFTRPLEQPHTGYIRFVRSDDGGRSFRAPITVQRDLTPTGHRFDSLVVDPRGRIFVAWIDKRDLNLARARQQPYRGAAIYYAVSSDGGRSFGPDIRLADHCCECCRIALAVGPDGTVSAMWRHIFAPNVRDHALAVLSASGRPAPVARATVDDWRIDACPHHGPALAFDRSGGRHQVWFSGADEGGGLFYQEHPRARSAGPVERLGGVLAEHGEVTAAGRSVAVVWKEFDGDVTHVMAQVKSGSAGWQRRSLASSRGASDHPHLASNGNAVWLVWRTVDEGIVVRRVTA